MKKIIETILLSILLTTLIDGVIYLFFAFYAISFNPVNWTEGTRSLFVIIAIFLLITSVVMSASLIYEE
jgi:hypothetical protein